MTALWPLERLGEALEHLARRVGARGGVLGAPPAQREALDGWVQDAAVTLGIDAEKVHGTVDGITPLLQRIGPGLVVQQDAFYVVLGARRGGVRVLAPDGREQTLPLEALHDALLSTFDARRKGAVDAALERVGMEPARRARASVALLGAWLAGANVVSGWAVQLPPSASPRAQLREAGAPRLLAVLLTLHAAVVGLGLGGWWMLGRGAMAGTLDWGWLSGWTLILLCAVALGAISTLCQEMLGVRVSALLRRRLLRGVLQLDADEVRHRGHGQFLSLALESEVLEVLVLGGGFSSILALPELAIAGVVVLAAPGGGLRILALAALLGVVFALARRVYLARLRWTEERLQLTHEVVARMVGQRTRLAQEAPERWFQGEDELLDAALRAGRDYDHAAIALSGLIPRAWMILGIATLLPAFAAASAAEIAVGLGGVLLVRGGLERLIAGLGMLMGAAVSWRQVRPLFEAAARSEPIGLPEAPGWLAAEPSGEVIAAKELRFRYRPDGPRVLDGASLRVMQGDRILLEGASGGGKSTLSALLVGLRTPESGVVHVRGLDRATLGARAWRGVVTAAPQFHDNHIISGTFAFNLLLGRRWPPEGEDMTEAEEVARGLGLGPLLERMPAGLGQMVGEIGWQLSHGEKSRVFLARALLQGSSVIVLDESFGALDPENLRMCMDYVLSRSNTLIVIAHP